jgi:hypothetical protein
MVESEHNFKRRGDWAELRFMADAAQHGLVVFKPWGDSERYDVGVEHSGHFQRVQVKSVTQCDGSSYRCGLRMRDRSRPYLISEVDFFAIIIVPKEIWYILPAQEALLTTNRTICLNPGKKGNRYEYFKEAWHLLQHRRRIGDTGDSPAPPTAP